MNTTTATGRRVILELGWPVPVLGAMCAVLAAMPASTALPTTSTLVVLLAALGNALDCRRQSRVAVAASAAAAAVSLAATFWHGEAADEGAAAWLLLESAFLLCVLAQTVRRVHGPRTVAAAAVLTATVVLAPLRLMPGARASPWAVTPVAEWCISYGLLAACAIAIGLYLRSLDEAREKSVHVAQHEQRVQLARDLHDWLGHEVTGLVLEAQAARVPGRTPAEVDRALQHIEEAGVRVLDSIDRALCWLRSGGGPVEVSDERSPAITDLPVLVSRFEALGSIAVLLELDDQVKDVQPEIAGTVHRVVMEALTNVRRHAPTARQVSVDVHRNGAHVIVRVANDGARREGLLRRPRAGGTGLRGLAERVAALGGTLWAGPAGPAGWAVHVVLPVLS